ncbi:MAG: glycoside hydrolase family 18 protein [Desulfuromonadaceae bacterium]
MKFQSTKKLISLLLVLILFSSCATLPPPGTPMTDEERQTAKNRCIAQYTVTGALAGAALGALVGYLAGGGKGAITGAVGGGVAGGVIAFAAAWNHCISLFSNLETYPVADYKQTAQDIGYQPSQGDLVEIKDLAISPPTATPGSTVNLTGKYIVMNADPNAKDIKVLIERGVAGFDEKTKTFKDPIRYEPTEKIIDATNRTNKLDGDFDLPDKVPPGKFKIIVRVTALGKTAVDGAEVEVQKGEKVAYVKPDKAMAAQATTPATVTNQPALAPSAHAAAEPNKTGAARPEAEPGKGTKPATLKEARAAKKNQDLEGALFQDKNSKVWYLDTEDGIYKLMGDKFVKVGAQTDTAPISAPAPAATATSDKTGPNKGGAKSLVEPEKAAQAPTLKEAREAKKNQELEGYLFQDSTSKFWYLENEDGTYRLKNGKFVLIRSN